MTEKHEREAESNANQSDLDLSRTPKLPMDSDAVDSALRIPDEPSTPVLDIASLRLGQNFQEAVGVTKALITVPVRKPGRQAFVRVREGEEWRLRTMLLELKEERETYIVEAPLWPHVADELIPFSLHLTIDRQKTLFLWPVKLPGDRAMAWHTSAQEAARIAEEKWVKVCANMHVGAYDVHVADGDLGEPEWPDASFEEILGIAFKDRIIDSLDHPVLKRLRGEA